MPPTALVFLPVTAGSGGNPSSFAEDALTSPSSTLINHISRTYTPKPLGSYVLEHRLLIDTSSLLPGHNAPRRYTHFLTLASQFPGKTFVGTSGAITTAESDAAHLAGGEGSDGSNTTNGLMTESARTSKSSAGLTVVVVPSHPDTLFPLLMQRMSPLWVPRQAHRIEAGVSFEMADWKVRIGELRISGGQGQGRVRGCVCEVQLLVGDNGGGGDQEEIGGLARDFLESLARGSGVTTGGAKVVGPVAAEGNELVRQYMELLKFAKSS